MFETEEEKERVISVGVSLSKRSININESMFELNQLIDAAGADVVASTIQNRESIQGATYIGKGKVIEVLQLIEMFDADTVVFNDELTGSQLRNLESILQCKVIDRTMLILDIFAQRAKSKEGMLQVQLAQLKYQLPRLVGMRTNLSRTGGGIGTRGPGEQKLETDRRHILRQIHQIEDELETVNKSRRTNRKKRLKTSLPIVALVGYTNAGKSTIMNALLQESGVDKPVEVKDMLFATLDATFRRISLNNNQPILITDTVGFVSQLPHALVAAFRGTLDEIQYADLIIHVVDASSIHKDLQMQTTLSILKDLDVLGIPMLTVFNKIDKVQEPINDLQGGISIKNIHISAHNPKDIDVLMDVIETHVASHFKNVCFHIPFASMEIVDRIANQYEMNHFEYTETGARFFARVSNEDAKRYDMFIEKSSYSNQ